MRTQHWHTGKRFTRLSVLTAPAARRINFVGDIANPVPQDEY